MLALLFGWVLGHAASNPRLTKEMVDDMANAYGFCLGQNHSLERIAKQFPDLAAAALRSRLEFEGAFQPSLRKIDESVGSLGTAEWDQIKARLWDTIRGTLDRQRITKEQAAAFTELVRRRAKGELEARVLQTLLAWHPDIISSPASEFAKGFKAKYVCDGAGKAKGIRFQIEHPRSWASLEAERPNIVRKFVSRAGRGTEFAMIVIKSIPAGVTDRDMNEILVPSEAPDLVPDGGKLIVAKRATVDGLPGLMMIYTAKAERLDQSVRFRCLSFQTVFRHQVVNMLFQTEDNQETFATFEPLFRLMANSMVILSRYE